jgi:cytidine deaminase
MTPEQKQSLVQAAMAVRENAYVPYSRYKVGAALLTPAGAIIPGCNLENAAYTPGICAERSAVAAAISQGQREFSAVAVVTENGGAPCGVCRQTLYEFAPQMWVIIANAEGQILQELRLDELLPHGFGADFLPK